MDWRDPFEKKWKEICECAGEIAAVKDVILSVEQAPVLESVPGKLSVRTWRFNGKIYLLVCNASGRKLKSTLPLGGIKAKALDTIYGGGVSLDGKGGLSVDFPLEGYAFLSL